MREIERMREKTTIHLDGRHIFGVFVGCAVFASGIFVAGIWVGKRLATPAAPDLDGDPLAVIDQMGNEEETLSFEKGLRESPGARSGTREAPAKAEVGAKAPGPAVVAPAALARAAAPAAPSPTAPEPAASAAPAAPARAGAPAPAVAASLPVPSTAARSEAVGVPAAATPAGVPQAPGEGGAFTLQISSFQARAEADDYVRALGEKGYDAHIVTSEVPGKGLWYRVRVGDYATRDAALKAKYEFERKNHVVAYVIRK